MPPRTAALIVFIALATANPAATQLLPAPDQGAWSLEVFDLRGHRLACIASGGADSSPHETFWDGRNRTGRRLARGVYLVTPSGRGRILDAQSGPIAVMARPGCLFQLEREFNHEATFIIINSRTGNVMRTRVRTTSHGYPVAQPGRHAVGLPVSRLRQ